MDERTKLIEEYVRLVEDRGAGADIADSPLDDIRRWVEDLRIGGERVQRLGRVGAMAEEPVSIIPVTIRDTA